MHHPRTPQILSPSLYSNTQSINTPPSTPLCHNPSHPSLPRSIRSLPLTLVASNPFSPLPLIHCHFNTPSLSFLPLHHFPHRFVPPPSSPLSVTLSLTRLVLNRLLLPPKKPINICLSPPPPGNKQGEGGERRGYCCFHHGGFTFSRFYIMKTSAVLWANRKMTHRRKLELIWNSPHWQSS